MVTETAARVTRETELVYDLRGLSCPMPVLKTRRRLRDVPRGHRLTILTSDPLAVIDIPAFCREDGHELIAAEPVDSGHRFIVERGREASEG
nr:sulfurtransferase TusA family protein [Notoacmeibacter ruber]